MRQLFLLLLALPVFAVAQDKNVINVSRYFPKADKVKQFEKMLAAHAQKYHTGDYKWQVFTIESGPDAGGYLVVEGPASWDGVDNRGDISKAHTDDWDANVQSLLTDKYSSDFFVFRSDLSTGSPAEASGKISLNHMYQKPGYYANMEELIKGLKNAWTANGQTVAVYESSSSGEPQFMTITMYKQGLKERETGFRPTMPVAFAKANGGEDAWKNYLEGIKMALNRQWSEMVYFKPELSSK